MTTLGGWWMSTYALAPGEELVVKYPANLFRAERRPLGGRLYLTDRRLIFLPHRIDAFFGGGPVVIELSQITDTRIESPSERDEAERSIPERLQVDVAGGQSHLFIVSDPEKAHQRVRGTLEGEDEEEEASTDPA